LKKIIITVKIIPFLHMVYYGSKAAKGETCRNKAFTAALPAEYSGNRNFFVKTWFIFEKAVF